MPKNVIGVGLSAVWSLCSAGRSIFSGEDFSVSIMPPAENEDGIALAVAGKLGSADRESVLRWFGDILDAGVESIAFVFPSDSER